MKATAKNAAPRGLFASAGLVGARLAGAAIGLFTQLLLARLLAPEALGIFFFATSLAAVLGMVAAFGYPSIAVRFVSRYRVRGATDLAGSFVRQARRDAGQISALVALLVLGGAWALPGLSGETRWAASLAALSIPAIAISRVNGGLANGARRFGLAFLPELLIRPALFVLLIAGAAGLGLPLSAAVATALLSLVIVLLAAGQALKLQPLLPHQRLARPRRRLTRSWRRLAWPLSIVALVTSLFADLDLVLLGPFLPAEELAVFGICLKLSFLVGFVVQAVHQVASPDLADAHASRDSGATARALRRCNLLATGAAAAIFLATLAGGAQVLQLFGEAFVAGYPALVLLVGAQVLRAAAGPAVPLMTLIGGQGRVLRIALLLILTLIIGNAALAPTFGTTGAALAVVVAFLVWTGALALALHRRSGLRADVLASLTAFAGAASDRRNPLAKGA
ncbi:oligosaccharide flippase family protein [Afifella pfennigii]|uniref:oligosaccharide flippase family protein n=1 Tax=Afifella pfennigii TaxID=209897 RepID=UPI000689A496|nr:oligosaccharide flippase family protein [Afifella pfennigii]